MYWQPSSAWGQQNFGSGINYGQNPEFGVPLNTAASPPSNTSNFFGNGTNLGWNANTMAFGLQGLNSIANIYGAWQANKLAKDQLNFTKNFANKNLANQMSTYNTALEDRSRARAAVEGQSAAEAQAYIDRNRLR